MKKARLPLQLYPSPSDGIRCLLQSTSDAPGLAAGVAPASLLAPEELERCDSLRVPKRRRDWLLGRWTAKHLLQSYLAEQGTPLLLDEILISASPEGAPYASRLRPSGPERLPLSLSISHSGDFSFCALAVAPPVSVGADVETIEPRPASLAEQFFTPSELSAVLARPDAERDGWITLVWSAKEAFLKCIREGLRVDTRAIAVELPGSPADAGHWRALNVTPRPGLVAAGSVYRSWWRREGELLLTLGVLAYPQT
jgi:4'-phosphopantetheinyl transferase